MAQILKLKKKVRKATRSKSGVMLIQNVDLLKYVGKEVVVRIETA